MINYELIEKYAEKKEKKKKGTVKNKRLA